MGADEFLNAEALQPGDVLLFGSKTARSWTIRKATKSSFSHASIYVGSFTVFEALKKTGLSINPLAIRRVERVVLPGRVQELRVLCQDPEWTDVRVLRHKDAHGLHPSDVEIAALPYTGMQYSRLSRLLHSLEGLRKRPRLVTAFTKLERSKPLQSAYCSEVVVRVLNRLGLRVEPGCSPHQCSPETLREGLNGRLGEVPNVVVSKDVTAQTRPDDLARCRRRAELAASSSARLQTLRLLHLNNLLKHPPPHDLGVEDPAARLEHLWD